MPCEWEDLDYEVVFPDSEDNRLSMARFLAGREYPNLPRSVLLEGFERYRCDGTITMKTSAARVAAYE